MTSGVDTPLHAFMQVHTNITSRGLIVKKCDRKKVEKEHSNITGELNLQPS